MRKEAEGHLAGGAEQLFAELRWLDALIRREALRLRVANLVTENEFRGLYIADEQVDELLRQSDPNDASRGNGAQATIEELTQDIARLRLQNDMLFQSVGLDSPLTRLQNLFNLTPFEAGVLLIGLAPEIDLRYETLFAYLHNDVTRKRPSVDLALRLLSESDSERIAQRSAFAPGQVLRRLNLIQLVAGLHDSHPPLLAHTISVDQGVVSYVMGAHQVSEVLMPFTRLVEPTCRLNELSHPPDVIARLGHATEAISEGGVLVFKGPYGVEKQESAEAVCAELGLSMLVVDAPRAVSAGALEHPRGTLLAREALLRSAGLYLANFEAVADTKTCQQCYAEGVVETFAGMGLQIFIGSEDEAWQPAGPWTRLRAFVFRLPLPDFATRTRLWDIACREAGLDVEPDFDPVVLANKFVLSAGQTADAVQAAANLALLKPGDSRTVSMTDLHAAARMQSSRGLLRLAHKVESPYRWDDIVLPSRARQQLYEVLVSVRQRHMVYSTWQFGHKLALGKGINILFAGPSGTGKTMAAQVLANELRLDLYKIDLSSVVSKYIGETEKNLDRIFTEARASNAILFFDEADALFGKRSEVKDAHDRYANIEVAYLLQKTEEYDGAVILATNLRQHIDNAFTRRMHHIVAFSSPDAAHRELIWRSIFPDAVPLGDDVNLGYLARQFELTGGNIRNVALAAAFMAAEDGASVRMAHLIHATVREYRKIGKLPSRADFGEFYELIRDS